jgi:anti-sigma regulatory factor (Ser/Thr protein kinase)
MFAEDDFVTGLTLELDHTNLQLQFVSCGHPPMFLVRHAEVMALPVENGPGRNLPLGSLGGVVFEVGHHQLLPGDRLVLFTDGLLELGKSRRGTVLSVEEVRGIIESLVRRSPGLPVRTLVRNLLDAVNGSQGRDSLVGPPDDVTVLGVELEPDAGAGEVVFHPAGLRELDQAVKETWWRLMREWGIEPGTLPQMRLLLDEAVTNAWRHGNQQNPRMPITVRWGQQNGYSIVVDDAGSGFEVRRLPDPRSPGGLPQEFGRGVFLIRNSCEWAGWKKGGTRLVARLAGLDS